MELKTFSSTPTVPIDSWPASYSLSDAKAFANAIGLLASTTTIVEVAVKAVAAHVSVFMLWIDSMGARVAPEKKMTILPRPDLGHEDLSSCLPRRAGRHVSPRDLDFPGVRW